MLTFGAYIAFLFNVSVGMPLALALVIAMVVTAALGVLLRGDHVAADAPAQGRDPPAAPDDRWAWRSSCAT